MTRMATISYGLGIFGPILGWVAAMQYLMYFYTDVVGLDPAKAGLVFMIGMVWDAVSDPLIGYVADRTRTRWGRFRPYIIFGALPYAIGLTLAFSPSLLGLRDIFVATLVTHLVFRTTYTLLVIPYTAMLSRITTTYDSRTLLTSVKTAFIFIGNLIISLGFYTIVLHSGGGDEGVGFSRAALLFGVLAALTSVLCFAGTREPPIPDEETRNAKGSILVALRDLATNRAFMVLFVGTAVFGGFYGAEIAVTAYLAKYWLGDAGLARILFTGQAITSLLAVPFWYFVGVRIGKGAVWVGGILVSAAGMFALYLLQPTSVWPMAGIYALANFGAGGFILIFYAIAADTVDWGEWRTARRQEGIIFGAISFANKFAAGVATGAVGSALVWIGFVPNQTPSSETLQGMFVIGALIPAIAFLIAAALWWLYPLSRERHEEIMIAIGSGRQQAKASSAPARG